MNKNIFLISADFIRNFTNISNNMQDKFLQSAIRESQDTELRQVLGRKLLNKVCDLVDSGDIYKPENEDYKLLLDESQYFLAYSAITNLCLISSVKLDNGGLQTTNDINTTQIQLSEVFKLEAHYKNKMDFYKMELQNFLKKNFEKYPELKELDCYDEKPELVSSASTGIFLGGARGKRKRY